MFTLKEIVDLTGGSPVSSIPERKVSGVSTDSRTIRPGEIFIALKGERFDGASFIKDAAARGGIAAVVEKRPGAPGAVSPLDFVLIRVDNARQALYDIARAHRDRFDIPIIAVTGSNGKTTVKDMVSCILSRRFRVLRTDKNCNNKIGVAQTLLRLKDQEIGVIEIGASRNGEVRHSAKALRPSVAIITNIAPSHLEGLKDIAGVFKEKTSILDFLIGGGIWIKNSDDEMLSVKGPAGIETITYAIRGERADFKASEIKQLRGGTEFMVNKAHKFFIPLFGLHNVYNALASIAAASIYTGLGTAREALCRIEAPCMRMEVLECRGFTIIDDTYNSNPLSFMGAVSTLKNFPSKGKRVMVAADMLELGADSEKLHYDSGRFLAEEGIDVLVTFGRMAHNIAKGALDHGMGKNKVSIFRDKEKIAPFLNNTVSDGDIVLIKGSRGMEMEEVVDCFMNFFIR